MSKVERDAELRLDDILQAVLRIRTYVAGMNFVEFQASQLTFDAVAMNVLVIGESIGRLPERLKTTGRAPMEEHGRRPKPCRSRLSRAGRHHHLGYRAKQVG